MYLDNLLQMGEIRIASPRMEVCRLLIPKKADRLMNHVLMNYAKMSPQL